MTTKTIVMIKGKIAGKTPKMEDLEAGKNYAWCTCGESLNQPFCNGGHLGTDFKAHIFKSENAKTVALCTCKQTDNPPYCDGAHRNL